MTIHEIKCTKSIRLGLLVDSYYGYYVIKSLRQTEQRAATVVALPSCQSTLERDNVYFHHFYPSVVHPLLLQNIKMEIQKPSLSWALPSRDRTFLQDDEQDRAEWSDHWYLGDLQEISEKWTPLYQHTVTELSLDRRLWHPQTCFQPARSTEEIRRQHHKTSAS